MLSKTVFSTQDSTYPHSTRQVQEVMNKFGWEIFDYPPYSPERMLSDFHLPTTQNSFCRKTFKNTEEVKQDVNSWLRNRIQFSTIR